MEAQFNSSIFESYEHFEALWFVLWDYGLPKSEKNAADAKKKPSQLQILALKHLELLLNTCRSYPLAIWATFHLLDPQSSSLAHGLYLLQFLSQLSDTSPGNSVLETLHQLMNEGSFLAEVRHQLAHQLTISDQTLTIATNIILEELRKSYWNIIRKEFSQSHLFQPTNFQAWLIKIYGSISSSLIYQAYTSAFPSIHIPPTHSINSQTISLRLYKQIIQKYLLDGEPSIPSLHEMIRPLSSSKKQIFLTILIQHFIKYSYKSVIRAQTGKVLEIEVQDLNELEYIPLLKQLRYLGLMSQKLKSYQIVISGLKKDLRQNLRNYWLLKCPSLKSTIQKAQIHSSLQNSDFIPL